MIVQEFLMLIFGLSLIGIVVCAIVLAILFGFIKIWENMYFIEEDDDDYYWFEN